MTLTASGGPGDSSKPGNRGNPDGAGGLGTPGRPRRARRTRLLRRLGLEPRALVGLSGLAVVLLGLFLAGLCRGDTWSGPGETLDGLLGRGDLSVVVQEWRLPRVEAACLFGAMLGCAGAVFQNLTRNDLGSPDVIGLDVGAYTGALLSILIGGSTASVAFGSTVGGLATALLVLALSSGTGFGGHRLIVIGIAVSAMLAAVNSWIVMRTDHDTAMAAETWNVGSLNGIDHADLHVPLTIAAGLLVLLVVLARPMHQAALGDAIAVTSGIRIGRHRVLAVVAGVGCTATVTAVTGPIAFVALAAPHIGRRITASPGIHLVPAALTGAVLLLAADVTAQTVLAPTTLPVGVVTTAIGGAYLLLLLLREVKRS